MYYFLAIFLLVLPACSLSVDLTSLVRPVEEIVEPPATLPEAPTFGEGGISKIRLFDVQKRPTYDSGEAIAIQPDGKFIVGGDTEFDGDRNHILVRFNSDGVPDYTFGMNGSVKISRAASEMLMDLKIQPDGKILIAVSQGSAFKVLRYMPDGAPDSDFGSDGEVSETLTGQIATITELGLQSDGKIVAAGYGRDSYLDDYDLLIARFNVDGSLDNTFGTGGVTRYDASWNNLSEWIYSMTILQNDKIAAAGTSVSSGVNGASLYIFSASGQMELMSDIAADFASESRFTSITQQPDGKLVLGGSKEVAGITSFFLLRFDPVTQADDPSFGVMGEVSTDFSGWGEIRDLVVIPTGEIIATGDVILSSPYRPGIAVAKYLPNGTLDGSFGNAGTKYFQMDDVDPGAAAVAALEVQSDGKILLIGRVDSVLETESAAFSADPTQDFAIVRMNTSGSFDSSFSNSGRMLFDVGQVSTAAREHQIGQVVQPDGKIVTLLQIRIINESHDKIGLIRQNADGSLDTSFRDTGRFVEEIFTAYHEPRMIRLQSDGKILVAGFVGEDSMDTFVVRFLADGRLDSAFANAGVFLFDTPDDTYQYVEDLHVLSNDSFLLVGGFEDYTLPQPDSNFFAIKLTADGSLEESFGSSGVLKYRHASYQGMTGLYSVPQADGKILVGGVGFTGINYENILVRFLPNGSVDTTFGEAGLTSLQNLNLLEAEVWKAHTLPDGAFLVTGGIYGDEYAGIVFAKIKPDGLLDASYGDAGVALLKEDNIYMSLTSAVFQSDGGVAFIGVSADWMSELSFIQRLDPNGKPDSGFAAGDTVFEIGSSFPIELFGISQNSQGDLYIFGVEYSNFQDSFVVRLDNNGIIKK